MRKKLIRAKGRVFFEVVFPAHNIVARIVSPQSAYTYIIIYTIIHGIHIYIRNKKQIQIK